MNSCFLPILCCFFAFAAVTNTELTSNQDIRRLCERKADEKFFSREKCEAFKECCREKCSTSRRSTVTNTCDERFYQLEERDCICGSPGSGSGSNTDLQTSASGSRGTHTNRQTGHSVQETCDNAGYTIIGSGRMRCARFRECCSDECRGKGSTRENVCEGMMYSLAEKRCECRDDAGSRGGGRGEGDSGESGRGDGGIRFLREKCERRSENEILDSSKCKKFKECCQSECQTHGRAVEDNQCNSSNFFSGALTCVCQSGSSGNGGSGGRNVGNDLTELCKREGDNKIGSGSRKCQEFDRCCRRECVYKGGVSEESKCEGMIFGIATKHCSCQRGSGRGSRGGESGERETGERTGTGSGGARNLNEICEAEGERKIGSGSRKCQEFNRCCRRECENLGGVSERSKCEGMMFGLATKHCSCLRGNENRGSGHSGTRDGESERETGERTGTRGSGSSDDLNEICEAEGERKFGSGSRKCQEFNRCCHRECENSGGVSERSKCEGMMFGLATKHCSCQRGNENRGSGHSGTRDGEGERETGERTGTRGSGSSNVGSTVDVEEICIDEGDDADGEIRDKCRVFKQCCERKCRAAGKSTIENACADYGTMYLLANKRCLCGSENGGGSEYERGGSANPETESCRSRARDSISHRARCSTFGTCCMSECMRKTASVEKQECDVRRIDDALCVCSRSDEHVGGRVDGSERGEAGGATGDGGIGNRSNEPMGRLCRSHVERGGFSSYEKCSEFRRCCRRECATTGSPRCSLLDFGEASCHCD